MSSTSMQIFDVLTAFLSAISFGASALQPDSPFLALQERQKAAWKEQDKQIDEKLAALKQRFGKRPNILYILTDDVGWGELGWQGGGKHRGTVWILAHFRLLMAERRQGCDHGRRRSRAGHGLVAGGDRAGPGSGRHDPSDRPLHHRRAVGGAMDRIPSDRVTDGVDQTALLLLGEGHSRRDYMFHYSGAKLGAVRWVNIKALIEGPGHGGLPGITMCNVVRDPGEKHCSMYPYLWTVTPFQNLVKSHMQTIAKFPHRKSEVTPDGAELTPHD